MNNRENNQKIANETIKIIEEGFYLYGKEKIDISKDVSQSIKNSKLYKPNDFNNIKLEERESVRTRIDVLNETALTSAKRLTESSYQNIVCLNFASGRSPGGGFLNGSLAQEESLARSSALYPCIAQMKEMYDYNKRVGTCLYSDYMIYSPSVPVFRSDKGILLSKPYNCSFISAPAVNAKVVKEREKQNVSQIYSVMRNRVEKILTLALIHYADALILGAFGCGVFDNSPSDIVKIFQDFLLKDERFKNKFKHIVFSVLDTRPNKELFNTFRYAFNR